MPAPKREYCCCEEDGAFLKERPIFADPPSQGGRRNAAPTKNMRKPKASPPQRGGGSPQARRWGTHSGLPQFSLFPYAAAACNQKPLGTSGCAQGAQERSYGFLCRPPKKSRSSGPLLEAVSNREPGNGLFWRRISDTSEPTASQCLRRINLSLAASLKSAKVRQPARSAVGRFAGVRRASAKTAW